MSIKIATLLFLTVFCLMTTVAKSRKIGFGNNVKRSGRRASEWNEDNYSEYGGGANNIDKQDGSSGMPYDFQYQVDEGGNNFGHSQKSDGNVVTGRYFVHLPDGRLQIVEFRADESGYTANVQYEEKPLKTEIAHHNSIIIADPVIEEAIQPHLTVENVISNHDEIAADVGIEGIPIGELPLSVDDVNTPSFGLSYTLLPPPETGGHSLQPY